MPDAHDGPISQGIRDAIRASDKTPYAIAKEVTKRGKVKLTGPQIYRFIKGDKGLSLAVLDEIGRVLRLEVRVVTVEDRKAEGPPHRIALKEAMDRLEAVAADTSIDHDQRVWALDRNHREIRRENLIKGDEIYTLYHLYSALRDGLRREKARASQPPPKMVDRRPIKAKRRPALDVDDDGEDGEGFGGDDPPPVREPFRIQLPRPKFMRQPIDDDESDDDDEDDEVDEVEDDEEWLG